MYIEFKGSLFDGKVIFLAIPAETIVCMGEKETLYHYRKTSRKHGRCTIYQYLGILTNENESENIGIPEVQS